MKDQITVMMEALRLAGIEVEHFKRKRQGRDETLDALEAILYDPKVRQAVENSISFGRCPAPRSRARRARTRMKLVQMFLPLYDNNGRRFPAKKLTPRSEICSWSALAA